MRKLLLVTTIAGLCLSMSHDATANFFPGKVVIVGGGSGGGNTTNGNGGSTTNAAAMAECPLQIECECFTGKTLPEACAVTLPPELLECVLPHTAYDYVKQLQLVLVESPDRTLGGLTCAGKSNSTAFVYLKAEEGGEQPPSP